MSVTHNVKSSQFHYRNLVVTLLADEFIRKILSSKSEMYNFLILREQISYSKEEN